MNGQQRRLIVDTFFLGIVGALSAQVFTVLLGLSQGIFLTWMAGYRPPALPNEGGILQQVIGPYGVGLLPLATTMGGLLSGWRVYRFAPEAEGHGTDTAAHAFHRRAGLLRARVPPLKLFASAITIGSGGAAGREGPTALISAGIGSVYATWTHRTDEERRLRVLIGRPFAWADEIPDSQDSQTFARSRLSHSLREQGQHSGHWLKTLDASANIYGGNAEVLGLPTVFAGNVSRQMTFTPFAFAIY